MFNRTFKTWQVASAYYEHLKQLPFTFNLYLESVMDESYKLNHIVGWNIINDYDVASLETNEHLEQT